MGRICKRYLHDSDVYCCVHCGTHFTKKEDIVSTDFHGRKGRAFLSSSAVNVTQGPVEERMLTTGLHIVVDTFCIHCLCNVGWRYEIAYVPSQKYKEKKFIFEESLMRLTELEPSRQIT